MNRPNEKMKTARERFEEAGWHFEYDNEVGIEYSFPFFTYIKFFKESREYYVIWNGDYAYVDMKLHKLITYQLEELGWL